MNLTIWKDYKKNLYIRLMDFSNAYFGKSLSELEYNDIETYFQEPKQETETIEFKAFPERATFDAGLQNVIRGISAFLNSSGGILIWGAPRGRKPEGLTEEIFVGALAPVREYKEKDALINKISSSIVPLPIGVNVQVLNFNETYIYVFEIQPSSYKPHQYDTRYYVRLDGQTKPAPHYLVDALMKQISYPNINGVIKFHTMTRQPGGYLLPITVAIFNFSELQNEESVSFRILAIGGYFARGRSHQFITHRPQYNMRGQQLIYENFASVLHYGTPNIHEDAITIDTESLTESDGFLILNLSFGGRKSPAKISSYKLDLSNVMDLNNPNGLLTEVSENVLFAELPQRLNNTPQDTLTAFLER